VVTKSFGTLFRLKISLQSRFRLKSSLQCSQPSQRQRTAPWQCSARPAATLYAAHQPRGLPTAAPGTPCLFRARVGLNDLQLLRSWYPLLLQRQSSTRMPAEMFSQQPLSRLLCQQIQLGQHQLHSPWLSSRRWSGKQFWLGSLQLSGYRLS